MDFYWIKTPIVIKRLFNNQVWDIPNTQNKIYLTFDDGPTPEITEWVLDVLNENNIKATFFCIGINVEKYPEIFKKVIKNGHSIGNHTFNHIQGWKATTKDYLENAKQCENAISNLQSLTCNLFRPPYGKIKSSLSQKLQKLGYKVVMWDVLSAAFDQYFTPEKCSQNTIHTLKLPIQETILHILQRVQYT